MIAARIAGVCVLAAAVWLAPGGSLAKDKRPKISEQLKAANELMTQAEEAYMGGKNKQALELYRQALEEIGRVERENQTLVPANDLAPLRYRRAVCETEIDRVMLEDVSAAARTMAVTDTSALEAKREARRLAAETNSVPEVTVKLGAKRGDPAAEEAGATVAGDETAADGGAEKPLDVAGELEWAKDMISVDRFEDAERSLVRVLKPFPANRDARFLMGVLRVQQGRHADAAVVLSDLAEDAPGDEAVLLLASGVHVAAGAYGQAMESLDLAMKANPKRPDGYLNMAWLLLEMNPAEQGEAEMYYRQAVKLGASRDRDIERRLGIRPE